MGIQGVQRSYEGKSINEWDRLQSNPYNRIEFLITDHALKRYLPKGGYVLDAGSGPGRYAIQLAQRGYKVAMLDAVHEMLTLGQSKVFETGLVDYITSLVNGDISFLPYESSVFDAVISLGAPLSHLIEENNRYQAIKEMVRVLKPGGCLFVTGLNRISIYRAMVYWMNESLITQFKSGTMTKSGVYNGFITGYAFKPGELSGMVREAGVQVADEVGCEGLAAHLPLEHLQSIEADPEFWIKWKSILLETCNEPSVIGVSNHLLVVGYKKNH